MISYIDIIIKEISYKVNHMLYSLSGSIVSVGYIHNIYQGNWTSTSNYQTGSDMHGLQKITSNYICGYKEAPNHSDGW